MTLSRFIRISKQRLYSLFRKEQRDGELDQELLFHLEELEKENLEAGMSATEARRAARRTLGNMGVLKEECRDVRRVTWLYDFCRDVRYGLRMMRKQPGFTVIAAISLALGIGGNTAILSVGATLLWGDLPVPDAERVLIMRTFRDENPEQSGGASIPDYVAWKERNRTFESMGASIANQQDLTGDGIDVPERLFGLAVTPSLFDVLQVPPVAGRLFVDADAPPGKPASPVIILSHRLWHRRFAGDLKILGKTIRMDGRELTVVGIMPRDFWFPNKIPEFWVPFVPTRFQLDGSPRLFTVTGRLKTGVTMAQADADVAAIAARLAEEFPDRHQGWGAGVTPVREHWFGWIRRPLLTLESAVVLVLLIACANVCTLLLARVPARQPEITMRLLLGAGRGRIVRQFLTESFLLSMIGGVLGVLIAWWGLSSLAGVEPPPGRVRIPVEGEFTGVIGIAALLSILSSLLFGFLPALLAFSSGNGARQATVHRSRGSLSGVLVSVQVGLALILLVSSGLLINSFVRLVFDDRGFDPKDMLTFEYRVPFRDYAHALTTYRGMPATDITPPTSDIQRVYEKLKGLPGTESVAGASVRPVNGLAVPTVTVMAEGSPAPSSPQEREAANVFYFLVTDNFLETMKMKLLLGRDFDERDTRSGPWVAVINETMARRFWPGENPVGRYFTVDAAFGEQPRQVIGVVRDVGIRYIRTGPPQAVAYTLYLQQPERFEGFNANMFGQMTFFLRSRQDPSTLASAVRRAVAEIDPDRPLSNIVMMTQFVEDGIRTRRYYATATGIFAFMATLLAAVGVYGVMSSSVSQRTREIGIHRAMGAGARDIVRLIGNRAFLLVVIGLCAGFLASLALTRLLETLLWGIEATDPATFLTAVVLLTVVSAAACFIPARRAMRVDPTEALRID